jgi:hypothetical protein
MERGLRGQLRLNSLIDIFEDVLVRIVSEIVLDIFPPSTLAEVLSKSISIKFLDPVRSHIVIYLFDDGSCHRLPFNGMVDVFLEIVMDVVGIGYIRMVLLGIFDVSPFMGKDPNQLVPCRV